MHAYAHARAHAQAKSHHISAHERVLSYAPRLGRRRSGGGYEEGSEGAQRGDGVTEGEVAGKT